MAEEQSAITKSRIAKERSLLRSSELTNCSVHFPEDSRDLKVTFAVAGEEVSFFIHLPEQYPFHPPRVACQPSPNLVSLSAVHEEENIVAIVLGESWIPAINLVTLVGRLQYYVQHQFKSRVASPVLSVMQESLFGTTFCVLLVAFVLRVWVACGSHSGEGKYAPRRPPMYGDYEAQRHWMELTNNLPPGEWYRNSTNNDLQYWGLDYPPLTAYHSYVLGLLSRVWEPSSVGLHSSRGYETHSHKLFMRLTVLASDAVFLVPALWFLFTSFYRYVNRGVRHWYLLLILCWPGLLLVDHGHFQYNCVMLGLVVLAAHAAIQGNLLLSSLCFALALNYKITALYFSLPFFVVLLLRARQQATLYSIRFRSTKRLVAFLTEFGALVFSIGAVAISVSLVLWFPWISDMGPVWARLFPFERGLFEDKVANFWCVASIVLKFRSWNQQVMVLLSAAMTLAACLPSLICLWRRGPTSLHFLYALGSCSMAFYLFSYHVHEKAILLPLLPYLALTALEEPGLFPLLGTAGVFSMYPLFVKDGLRTQYFLLTAAFWLASTWVTRAVKAFWGERRSVRTASTAFYCGMVFVHLLESLEPPAAYPYLFDTAVTSYCFLAFAGAWAYLNWKQWKLPESDDICAYVEPSFRHKPKFA